MLPTVQNHFHYTPEDPVYLLIHGIHVFISKQTQTDIISFRWNKIEDTLVCGEYKYLFAAKKGCRKTHLHSNTMEAALRGAARTGGEIKEDVLRAEGKRLASKSRCPFWLRWLIAGRTRDFSIDVFLCTGDSVPLFWHKQCSGKKRKLQISHHNATVQHTAATIRTDDIMINIFSFYWIWLGLLLHLWLMFRLLLRVPTPK